MKLNLRSIFASSCVAVLFFAVTSAKADTVTASIWANGTTTNVPAAGAAIYSTTPTITVSITNADASALFNFYSVDDGNLTSFLTTGANYTGSGKTGPSYANGDTITYLTGGNQTGSNAINNDLFQFTGTTTLTNGTYDTEHDDGLILYLNGSAVINQGGPTSADATAFTVCASGCNATPGTYSFVLDYAEVDGAPAALKADLPLVGTTPEPSSFMLLGSSLLGAAGMLRRRMKS